MRRNHACLVLLLTLLSVSPGVGASADTAFDRGSASFKAGNYAAAIDHFEQAMHQGMQTAALYYNLASSHYKLGDYASAATYYQKVAEYPPMKDLAEYNLGLIAKKQQQTQVARQFFEHVVANSQQDKLIALASHQLANLKTPPRRLSFYASVNIGHDDNITSTPNDLVSGIADDFYDAYLSADWRFTGSRRNSWAIDASYFTIDYRDTDANDEYQTAAGVTRTIDRSGWLTRAKLNTSRNYLADTAYQSAIKLDIKGRRVLSRRGRLYLRYRYEDIDSEQTLYDYLSGWRQRARVEYRHYAPGSNALLYYEVEFNDRQDLVTSSYSYDYSPTRHTLRGRYTHNFASGWNLGIDIAYRFSDFPASSDFNRDDDQWKLALSSDYRFDNSFKLTAKLQFLDNESTVERYRYDKTTLRLGLSKLFQ